MQTLAYQWEAVWSRYADHKAVVANSRKKLQQLMAKLNKVTQKFGMKIHVKKTNVMCISKYRNRKVKICIDIQMLEQIEQYRYLDMDSLILVEGYCEKDI